MTVQRTEALKQLTRRAEVAIAALVSKSTERPDPDEIVAMRMRHDLAEEMLEGVAAALPQPTLQGNAPPVALLDSDL
jgi:hypothetical protein